LYFRFCLGYNVVVYGLEIVRFLSCLKIALYVFDKMSQWFFVLFFGSLMIKLVRNMFVNVDYS